MWRFRPFLPLTPAETPVSLGEGGRVREIRPASESGLSRQIGQLL